ncbi:MAG TPA: DUF192 domain-containing protein [Polyangiaceae bacterium]
MRVPVLFGLAALGMATCQRVEEPAPTRPPEPALAAAPAATTPPATESAPLTSPPEPVTCVVPLAEPPPPPAKPAASCPADPVTAPPVLRMGRVAFPEATGSPSVEVEIADTPATERRGLMYRTKLGAQKGMIFAWKSDSYRTFWMQNTCLPLDMLFIAKDGTIAGILEQVPVLNEEQRTVRCPVAYVLEVNAGWTRRHGVKPGMKADITL